MNRTVQSHGSIPYADLRDLQIDPSTIIDFSATVNPYPLPEQIQRLFSSEGISAYPDTECYEARRSLSAHYEIPTDWITITAGLTETIFILPHLYKRAVQFSPTYGDYSAAYQRLRKGVQSVRFPRSDADFGVAIDALKSKTFRLLIICNPNNPTGDYLPVYRIQELCEQFGHATICIDESYQEMGENCDSAMQLTTRFRNLLVLKSLTKPFGIGGLRAGYAVSSGGVLKRIRMNLMPWGVSSIAQRIVLSLINNHQYFRQQWTDILVKKHEILQALSNEGFAVSSGMCPFFLVKTGNAEHTRQRLLKEHHIAIRSCASFGMPEWVRIMPGREEQNLYLIDAIRMVSDRK